MSRIYEASQYEQDYLPRRLGNWEVPSERALTSRQMTIRARTGRTQFVVDSRGYLVGAKKPKSAFNLEPTEVFGSPARWPKNNPSIKGASAATMGYKGVMKEYGTPLPH